MATRPANTRKTRSLLEIYASVLEAVGEGGSKRAIMYGCLLDHRQFTRYMARFVERGLVREANGSYELTTSGSDTLALLNDALSKLTTAIPLEL